MDKKAFIAMLLGTVTYMPLAVLSVLWMDRFIFPFARGNAFLATIIAGLVFALPFGYWIITKAIYRWLTKTA